jgi:hypothetical protein
MVAASALALTLGQIVQVEITPKDPLPMGGYTARGDIEGRRGDEGLFARAVSLTDGTNNVVLISLELLTIPESLVTETQARLPAGTRLLMTATHTHCAPDSQMLNDRMTFKVPGISSFKRRELNRMADLAAQAAKGALKRPIDVSQGVSLTEAKADLNRGRRTGSVPLKTVTRLQSGNQDLISIYAAHATTYEEGRLTWSGDWPGRWMKLTDGLVMMGAIGDVSPAAPGASAPEKVRAMAEGLEAALKTGSSHAMPAPKILWAEQAIAVSDYAPHPEFSETYGIPTVLARGIISKFAPPSPVLSLVSIGDTALVGVPGEPSSALARRIMRQGRLAGFRRTVVISHANGWMGYILEPFEYWRGGYEATLMFNGPSTADQIVIASGKGLQSLSALRRRTLQSLN